MKKILIAILCIAVCLPAACDASQVDTQGTTVPPTQPPTLEGVDAYADNDGNNVNYLCGIDVYGRVFQPVAGFDETKEVGIFYFLWHGESGKSTFNVTELLKNDPETLYDLSKDTNEFHYWGEPLYGYYRSWDQWVIRRHVEMLINAGIDYLIFDATNGFHYKRSYTAVFDVLTEYQQQGWDVPLVCFYTNSHSCNTVRNIYNDVYKNGSYKSLWYCPKGDKPMIITDTDDPDFKNYQDILAFFDVRESQWPNAHYLSDGVPWMEWSYPQPLHNNGYMNVSVAQHPQLPFSASITDRSRNWGRGYNYKTKQNVEEDFRKGTNFQSQWDTALNNDKVTNVFVTGWNEWIAQKLNINNELYFVDCANEEFSRDIEPMKGGYEDSFYLQLCDNVRRFKGIKEQIRKTYKTTVDINDLASWDGVTSLYKAVSQNSVARDSSSVDRRYQYKTDAARNNIQQVKLANDSEKLYFLATAQEELKSCDSADFVNLYIGVGDLELKGWNGYEFVLSCGDKALYALDASGTRTKVADAQVAVSGKSVSAAISLSDLGLADAQGIYFKVTDGVGSTDIMDTYVDGKCMPMGRLSYYYYFGV